MCHVESDGLSKYTRKGWLCSSRHIAYGGWNHMKTSTTTTSIGGDGKYSCEFWGECFAWRGES